MPTYAGKEATVERILRLYVQDVYSGQEVLGKMDEKRLEAVQDLYLKQGIIKRATPVAEMYTNQFVQ
jgi:NitT/TauT family transport system substrate-binding protein